MKLEGPLGTKWRFKIPLPGNLGTIHPAPQSIGIKIFTLAGTPPGESWPATGQMWVGIHETVDKTGSTWQFGMPDALSCGYTGWQRVVRLGEEYPKWSAPGSPPTGWKGTQWQQWMFAASGVQPEGDLLYHPDARLWIDGSDPMGPNAGKEFEIVFQAATSTAIMYVLAFGLCIKFARHETRRHTDRVRIPRKRLSWWEIVASQIPAAIALALGQPWIAAGLSLSGTLATDKRIKQNKAKWYGDQTTEEKQRETDPEGLYLWHPGYYDAADTYGGGTDQWVTSPGAILQFIQTHYSKPQRSFTNGADENTFGSVKMFNAFMNRWWNVAGGIANERFRMNFWWHDQETIGDAILAILDELPGMARVDYGTPGGNMLLATTDDWSASGEGTTCLYMNGTNTINPYRDILRDARGQPRIQINYSPLSTVVNDLEIQYEYDPIRRKYGRIAKCSPSASDDGSTDPGPAGEGFTWPPCPGSGISAEALCARSEQLYGPRKRPPIKLQYIIDPEAAVAKGLSELWSHWRQIASIEWDSGMSLQDLREGKLVEFSDDLRIQFKLPCAIPSKASLSWVGRYWHVISAEYIPGKAEPFGEKQEGFYHFEAIEHLGGWVGPGGAFGGPALTPAGEGFDL